MMDDSELLRAYVENRSETAFAEFVERRVGFVYAAALRMVAGNAHTAQDVTQTVFVLAANKAAELAGHERLAGWLHTTTRNVSHKMVREACRRALREQEAARMSEIDNENRDNDAGSETHAPGVLRTLLDEALGALREVEREAVLLRYFEGMAFAGIGGRLRMSEDSARKSVSRAVEKMRAAFASRGVKSSAASLAALMTAEAAQAAPAGLAAGVMAAITSAGATATAVVAGASTGTGAILAFLSSAKMTTIAVIALLVTAGGAYYGAQTAQNERATSAALARARQENATLAARLRALEKQHASRSAAGAAAATDAARRDQQAAERAAGDAFLAAHPAAGEAVRTMQKAHAAGRYFRIMHALNLSPEQSARFAEIMGAFALYPSSGHVAGYGNVRLAFLHELPPSERDRQLRELLGDAGFEKFTELNAPALNDAGINHAILTLGNALYFTDAPLTSRQAWRIQEIFADLRKNHAGITDPQARWDALTEQARQVLSPAQMRALAEAGDMYVWRTTASNWLRDYDKTHTVKTDTPPPKYPQ